MTQEEAIEILKEVKTIDDSMYQFNSKYMEALDMAIKVLKPKEITEEDVTAYCKTRNYVLVSKKLFDEMMMKWR